MSLRVLVPPAAAPLTVAEAKSHLRFFETVEDAVIAGYIRAATAALDGPDGALGIALITQPLELCTDVPCRWCAIRLPCPPLQAVESVSYVDQDGAEQTVNPAVYQAIGVGDQGWLALAYGQSWPSMRFQPEALRVTYRAGFG